MNGNQFGEVEVEVEQKVERKRVEDEWRYEMRSNSRSEEDQDEPIEGLAIRTPRPPLKNRRLHASTVLLLYAILWATINGATNV